MLDFSDRTRTGISKLISRCALLTYTYRVRTPEAEADFRWWIVQQDWADVLLSRGSDSKAEKFQDTIEAALDTFFPTRTVRRKSTELPWINRAIRKRIERMSAHSVRDRRTARWRRN